LKLSTRPKITVIFVFHTRRAAALPTASSARTASRRAPGIASGYVRQNFTFISAPVLSFDDDEDALFRLYQTPAHILLRARQ